MPLLHKKSSAVNALLFFVCLAAFDECHIETVEAILRGRGA